MNPERRERLLALAIICGVVTTIMTTVNALIVFNIDVYLRH